ncbi:MAG: ABC transporter ATP-binding protein [Spirochaetaceae bacterium]|nr:MAG: ABC transporter ATP-binding protein [Spirochaetaceae bacterium]
MSFTIGTGDTQFHGPGHIIRSMGQEQERKSFDLKTLLRLLVFLRPHWQRMLVAFVFMLTSSGLTLLTPYLVKLAIDRHIVQGDLAGLGRIALLTAVAFLALAFSTAGQQYILSWVGHRVLATLRADLFRHLQRMHLGYHDTHIIGVTLSRVINDVEIINHFLSEGLINLVGDSLILVGIVTVMIIMSPALALVTFSVLPFMFLATILFSRHAKVAYRTTRTRVAAVVGNLAENLAGMRVIQAFAQEESSLKKFDQVNRDNLDAHVEAMSLAFIFLPAVEFLGVLAMAIVLWFGGYSVIEGTISIGTVVAFLSYVTRFFAPIREISQIYTTMQASMAGGEKVIELLESEPEIHDTPDAVVLPGIRGKVEFRRVSFAYNEITVLADIDLTIEPGQTIALVGQTGAGKTTMANLVARLYDVSNGAILIDDIDIRMIAQKSLRSRMGFVSQDPFLFTGTIADNIRFGAPEAPMEAIVRAAEAANAHSFISRLSDGYDTQIQEGGVNLSNGQRQLLCIARAILADPRIIILDEATASVDTLTETLIQEALAHLFSARTAIVIAHRLSTVQNADLICVMDAGKIVEVGKHEHLLSRGGIYRELYDKQFIDKETL